MGESKNKCVEGAERGEECGPEAGEAVTQLLAV